MAASSSSTSEKEKLSEKTDFVYALHLWPCAPILAQYIVQMHDQFNGRTVIELGSGGTAVPGIAAAKCGAKVIFSDRANHKKAFELCRRNCEQNGQTEPDIREIDWNKKSELENLPKLDWILASDCFYDPSVFSSLITTIAKLLEVNTRAKCLFAYQERSSDWTIDILLEKLSLQCQFVIPDTFHSECVDVPGFNIEMRRHTIHIGIINKKQ